MRSSTPGLSWFSKAWTINSAILRLSASHPCTTCNSWTTNTDARCFEWRQLLIRNTIFVQVMLLQERFSAAALPFSTTLVTSTKRVISATWDNTEIWMLIENVRYGSNILVLLFSYSLKAGSSASSRATTLAAIITCSMDHLANQGEDRRIQFLGDNIVIKVKIKPPRDCTKYRGGLLYLFLCAWRELDFGWWPDATRPAMWGHIYHGVLSTCSISEFHGICKINDTVSWRGPSNDEFGCTSLACQKNGIIILGVQFHNMYHIVSDEVIGLWKLTQIAPCVKSDHRRQIHSIACVTWLDWHVNKQQHWL